MPEQRQVYVGHRYVPKIMGEWSNLISYEGLSIVLNEGNSYTSKKMVPIGIALTNEEFWVSTGNYNAQLESYRQLVMDNNKNLSEFKTLTQNQLINKMSRFSISPEDFEGTDTEKIKSALEYASLNNQNVIFSGKQYTITETIYLPTNVSINGNYSTVITELDIVMFATEYGKKLNNVTIENLYVHGASNPNFTNNHAFNIASIYGIFENIEITYCYDGFIQHSDGVPGNQVTNIYRNFRIRYMYGRPMFLGKKDNGAITDGWLENINLGSSTNAENHLYIGSTSGYYINDVHTWGNLLNPIYLVNIAHTKIDGLYIEQFEKRALTLHIKSELNLNNVKTHFTGENKEFIYFSGASTSLYNGYKVNMSNIVVHENSPYTTNMIFNAENGQVIDINIINYHFNLVNTKLNNLPTKINITLGGFMKQGKNGLEDTKGFTLTKSIKRRVDSGEVVKQISIPLPYDFTTYDSKFLKVRINLGTFWNQFSTKTDGEFNVYLITKDGTVPTVYVQNVTTAIGFTSEPTFTFLNNELKMNFTVTSASVSGFAQFTID